MKRDDQVLQRGLLTNRRVPPLERGRLVAGFARTADLRAETMRGLGAADLESRPASRQRRRSFVAPSGAPVHGRDPAHPCPRGV